MIDPEVVRDAVLSVPGVVGMHEGPHGTAATFCARGRVWGVRVDPACLHVHLVGEPGRPLVDLGRAVHDAVQGVLAETDRSVIVHIEDVTEPQPRVSPPDGAVVQDRRIPPHTDEPRRTS